MCVLAVGDNNILIVVKVSTQQASPTEPGRHSETKPQSLETRQTQLQLMSTCGSANAHPSTY